MLWLDSAMMRSLDPSFQIAEYEVDHRQMCLRFVGIAAKRQHVMVISARSKPRIAGPPVSSHGSANRDILFDEAGERFRAPIGHDTKPQPSRIDAARVLLAVIRSRSNLHSADNDRFVMGSASLAARLAADHAFINFDQMLAPDGVTFRANHTGAKLVKYLKSRLITSESKLTLELDGRLSRHLRRHEVRAPKPRRERRMAGLHDGSGRKRRVGLATTAAEHDRRTRCEPIGLPCNAALWARKPVRPTDRFKIASASRIVGEYPLKLRKRSGKTANVHA
jgi:hypothetical protein